MKGQFFLVGAIILCIMFWAGLPIVEHFIFTPSEDLGYLSDNVQKEIPLALNLGLNESNQISVLKNFTSFLEGIMTERFINFSCLWLVAEGNKSSTLNVTVGNFLNWNTTVTLNLSGTVKNLSIDDNSTNSTLFTANQKFNLTIGFDSEEKTVEWHRDKINLYAWAKLERGEDFIKSETIA